MTAQESYFTIAGQASAEIEEKKSRFLGTAFPVQTEEEAEALVASIRKEHYKARHHCFAWILGPGGENRRYADDGEPSGTAGGPILHVIEGAGVTNTLVVVTRYFGGILLGTGGLARAYTRAAAEALAAANKVEVCLCRALEVSIAYGDYDRLTFFLDRKKEGAAGERVWRQAAEPVFAESVTMHLTVRAAACDDLAQAIVQETGGRARIRTGEEDYLML